MVKDLLYELNKAYIESIYILEVYEYDSKLWYDEAYAEQLTPILDILVHMPEGLKYRVFNAYDIILEGITHDT